MSEVTIFFICANEGISIQAKTDELFAEVVMRYYNKIGENYGDRRFYLNSQELLPTSGRSLADYNIGKNAIIDVKLCNDIIGAGCPLLEYNKEINIKFIKNSKKIPDKFQNTKLIGLLKLGFLKELSSKLSTEDLKQLPDLTQYLMSLLKKGYIKDYEINIKETIKKVLERMQGSNIINFSDFVDEVITANQINEMLNLLNSEDSN